MGESLEFLKIFFEPPSKSEIKGLYSTPSYKEPQTCKKCGLQKKKCKWYGFTLTWSVETKVTTYGGTYQYTTTHNILGKEGAFLCPQCRRKYFFQRQLINFNLGIAPGIIALNMPIVVDKNNSSTNYFEKIPAWQALLILYAMLPGIYFVCKFLYLFIDLPNFFEHRVIRLCEEELKKRFKVDYIGINGAVGGNLCVFTSEGASELQKKYKR